jgi:hypothetical protein
MGKNVMIPLSLLDAVVELLEELNPPEYHELRYEYCKILWLLTVKKQKLELRDAYAKIISAYDEDARDEARIRYLAKKRFVDDLDEGIPF